MPRHFDPEPRPSSSPSAARSAVDLRGIAVFFDVENILIGIQGDFELPAVTRFLSERGELMILRAYADWGRYRRQQRPFLEEGVQMEFLPSYGQSDKDRTDTAICVDAMEVLFTRPRVDTFCIVSGDSDFAILAQRLRDHGRRVIGISARSAASPVLIKQCHEFVFYEALVGQRVAGYSTEEGESRLKRALERLIEDGSAGEVPLARLQEWMRRDDPTFSERNYGAPSFTRFLLNYEHLVEVAGGGLVRVIDRTGAHPSASKAGAVDPEVVARARGIILRTALEAAKRHGAQPVPLSRLKDTMSAVAPDFDEIAVGYRSFTDLLAAFPDLVVLEREKHRARPNAGIIPEGVAVESRTDPHHGPERRRRARDNGTPPASQPEDPPAPKAKPSAAKKASRPAKAQHKGKPRKQDKGDRPKGGRGRRGVKQPKAVEKSAATSAPPAPAELPLLASERPARTTEPGR